MLSKISLSGKMAGFKIEYNGAAQLPLHCGQ